MSTDALQNRLTLLTSGFGAFASLSVLIFAALLSVILQSLTAFLTVLCIAIVPLIGAFYPSVVMAAFIFSNLLVPKLPLIPIKGYLVPIRIEDIILASALVPLILRHTISRQKHLYNPVLKWMIVFCVVTNISYIFGLYVLGTVPDAKIGFLYWLRAPEYFAACYLCLLGVTSWKQYKYMIATLVTIVALIGIYGMMQEFSLVPIFDAMHISGELVLIRMFPAFGEERMFSTFAGPYDLAACYLVVVPICIALWVEVESRLAKILLSTVILLSGVCFYLTYARAPLVAMPVVLFICLVMLGKRRLAVSSAVFCVVPALLMSGFKERLTYAVDDPFATYALGGRLQLGWADAFHAITRSPLLGTGPASLFQGMGVDCLYLMLLGIWGIGGLVSFSMLIAKAVKHQQLVIRTSHSNLQRALGIGLISGTVGLIINGLTVDTFYISKVAFLYWFLMGLLFAGTALEQRAFDRDLKMQV